MAANQTTSYIPLSGKFHTCEANIVSTVDSHLCTEDGTKMADLLIYNLIDQEKK